MDNQFNSSFNPENSGAGMQPEQSVPAAGGFPPAEEYARPESVPAAEPLVQSAHVPPAPHIPSNFYEPMPAENAAMPIPVQPGGTIPQQAMIPAQAYTAPAVPAQNIPHQNFNPQNIQPPRNSCETEHHRRESGGRRHEHVIVFPKMNGFQRFMIYSSAVAIWLAIVLGSILFLINGAFRLMNHANTAVSPNYTRESRDENIPSFNVPGGGSGFEYDFGGDSGNRNRDEDGEFVYGGGDSSSLTVGLGVTVSPFTPQTESDTITGGLVIMEMSDKNAFEGTDVRANDIITAAEGKQITSLDDLKAVLTGRQAGDKLTVTVARYTNGVAVSKDYEITLVKLD